MDSCASELDGGAKAEDGLILERPARSVGIPRSRAGIEDVLEVRLQHPPGSHFILVRHLDEGLSAANWRGRSREQSRVPIQGRVIAADMGIAHPDPEGVVVAMQE